MSREKAREFLKSKGLEDRILVTEADTSTVVTAAGHPAAEDNLLSFVCLTKLATMMVALHTL